MKTLVTHMAVDLDCITSCWLVKRFFPDWTDAQIVFIPQQTLWENIQPDSDPDTIYVDTGYGAFDHHQINEYSSASKRILKHLQQKNLLEEKYEKPLERMITFINAIDNFAEVYFPEPSSDRYEFTLYQTITGLRKLGKTDNHIVSIVSELLDGILELFVKKIKAEDEIKKGYVFESKYGKSLAMTTSNDEALRLAQKQGFRLVVMKEPQKGFARIKTIPDPTLDLTPVYESIKKVDQTGYWFLHIRKNMLLNGSSTTPQVTPTPLSLPKLIEIIKKI